MGGLADAGRSDGSRRALRPVWSGRPNGLGAGRTAGILVLGLQWPAPV